MLPGVPLPQAMFFWNIVVGTDMFLHLSGGSFWNTNQHIVLGALKLIIEAMGWAAVGFGVG